MTLFFAAALAALMLATAAPVALAKDAESARRLQVETSAHVDQFFRKRAMETYTQGRREAARRYFEFAASFADKSSQVALAIMYRDGAGVERDPARAYAWFDVAAERGYPEVLAAREGAWSALSEPERERAVALTTALHTKYGDAVAKPRLERRILSYRMRSLSARPTLRGNYKLECPRGVSCNSYMDPDAFDLDTYWASQDALWMPKGNVSVGRLEIAPEKPAK